MESAGRAIMNYKYTREDNTYSIWDNPNFAVYMVRNEKIKSNSFDLRTTLREFSLWGEDSEIRLRILKVIGDAVCVNEQQLRRYLSPFLSNSKTSAHLDFLKNKGFILRFKCYLENEVDDDGELINQKNPAPIALGLAGFLLVTHFYTTKNTYFMHPELWTSRNQFVQASTTQRFVTLNEVRCQLFESRDLRDWRWFPLIGGNSRYKKPTAVFQLGRETEEYDNRTWFIVERALQNQDYVGFLKDRMNLYRNIFEQDGYISVAGSPKDGEKVVVISCGTWKLARQIQEEVRIHTLPFNCWFLIDELFDEGKNDVTASFAAAAKVGTEYELKRIRINLEG